MSNTKTLTTPKFLRFSKPTNLINLIVHGQGVILFETKNACSLTFLTEDESDGLQVSLSTTEFLVTRLKNYNKYKSQTKTSGLTSKSGAYYWFSLDSQNQLLQAGIGEPRVETVCYKYQFDPTDKLWEANKIFLESLVSIEIPTTVKPILLLKDPITTAVPLIVKGKNELTMDDVASSVYLPNAALSPASQALYNCVAGEKFVLDTPDFPDFSKAIEYSIQTPGLWCNTRLKQKATEFGKDPQPLETYLRITLGQNNGESPGIPYVMEIWPVGHYSPIHNHGGANAVIRILHGAIHVKLFPFLCDEPKTIEPFATKDFTKDDITWISSTLNQVHQLINLDTNKDTCVTIQCYLYDKADTVHYDYFDYLDDKNAKKQYEPDSDMEFSAFKKTMKQEWEARFMPIVTDTIIEVNERPREDAKEFNEIECYKGGFYVSEDEEEDDNRFETNPVGIIQMLTTPVAEIEDLSPIMTALENNSLLDELMINEAPVETEAPAEASVENKESVDDEASLEDEDMSKDINYYNDVEDSMSTPSKGKPKSFFASLASLVSSPEPVTKLPDVVITTSVAKTQPLSLVSSPLFISIPPETTVVSPIELPPKPVVLPPKPTVLPPPPAVLPPPPAVLPPPAKTPSTSEPVVVEPDWKRKLREKKEAEAAKKAAEDAQKKAIIAQIGKN